MKAIITIFLLIYKITISAQSDKVAGEYALTLGNEESHLIDYKLTLNQDGTFYFHSYSNIKRGIPPIVNKYGKGKWSEEKNVITFKSDKQNDLDEKHTLDFTVTKARFITKSPRDKTDKIIKTRLQFLESEIPWISRIEMLKL